MVDDTNVTGDSKTNPSASSAEEKTSEVKTETSVSTDDKSQSKTSVQPEWESLEGSSQKRFNKIVEKYKSAMSERDESRRVHEEYLAGQAQSSFNQDSANKEADTTPDFQQAVDKLKKVGKFVTQEDLQGERDRNVLRGSHDRNEIKYQGEGTLPKYIREEVEDHARKIGNWNMEKAFKDLYHDEFLDYEISERLDKGKQKAPYTEKPKTSSATKEQPMTREYIQKKLAGPKAEAYAFYEKHKDAIEQVAGESSQTE